MGQEGQEDEEDQGEEEMSELVKLQLSPVFSGFRQRVERLRDSIIADGRGILRRELESSIRLRWFRSGATLASLVEKVEERGDGRVWSISPTATNKGAPYPLFGEYGTGIHGAATGRPAPRGYRYGDRQGMAARRFSRIAVAIAKPQVDAMVVQRLKRFVTVN